MAGLLVSVRSPAEAVAALEGGAAIIDVKEPRHGPLGRAADAVIAGVVGCVAGRRPVSAALGELAYATGSIPPDLTYAKFGLAGCRGRDWQNLFLNKVRERSSEKGPHLVLTAYADWQRADAPPVAQVVAFACRQAGNILLIDTYAKGENGGRRLTLLDWLSLEDLGDLRRTCRAAKVRLALAGSLGPKEIARLKGIQPDWIAVRGAVCAGGHRDAAVSAARVRDLVEGLASGG